MKRVLIITLALLALVALAVPAGAAKPPRVTLTATLPWPTVPAPLERDVGAFVNFEGDEVIFEVAGAQSPVTVTVYRHYGTTSQEGMEASLNNGVYEWIVPAGWIEPSTTKFVATATVNGQLADTTEVTVYYAEKCDFDESDPTKLMVRDDTRPNAACIWKHPTPGAYTLTIDGVPASMKRFSATIRDHAPGDYCYAHEFRASEPRTGTFSIPAGEGDCAGSKYDTDPYTWRDANPANFIVLAPSGSTLTLTLVGPSS